MLDESMSPITVHPYATVIPGRWPVQKTHRTIGQAHNAVANAFMQGDHSGRNGVWKDIYVYEFDQALGKWFEIEHYPVGTKKSDLPWRKK